MYMECMEIDGLNGEQCDVLIAWIDSELGLDCEVNEVDGDVFAVSVFELEGDEPRKLRNASKLIKETIGSC